MRTFVRGVLAALGLLTAVVGVWALASPDSFSEFVNFPPHHHFVHDVGAFQLGLGSTLLLAMIWADAAAVALAGYLVGGVAHTASHVADADLGGSPTQTGVIGLLSVLAAAALVIRWRELGWVLGHVGPAASAALAPFSRQKTVLLTTYRRDGTPVGRPVSIAVDGGRAYVRSPERAWKARHIRRNPVVSLAPCTARGTPTGPAVTATARRLSGAEHKRAARALARKYPMLQGVLVPLTHRLGRAKTGRTVHFELVLLAAGEADPAGERAPTTAAMPTTNIDSRKPT
jgi:PPOX class probable F420-dependent enzyme